MRRHIRTEIPYSDEHKKKIPEDGIECERCHGTGWVWRVDPRTEEPDPAVCPQCNGEGYYMKKLTREDIKKYGTEEEKDILKEISTPKKKVIIEIKIECSDNYINRIISSISKNLKGNPGIVEWDYDIYEGEL